jgi:LPS-assembly protein
VVDGNVYRVWEDPEGEDGMLWRAAPSAVAEMRWPLIRTTRAAAHVIEPIAQVIYTASLGDEVPNEDSQLPEFDETNLFSLNRFPGQDRFETGLRANLGINYTRHDPEGWSMGLTLGRVLRAEPEDDFAEGTGLAGGWSDYVGALSFDFDWGLGLVNRALFDDQLTFRRNELALAYNGAQGALRAAYVFLAEDDSNPILGPQPETNEFALDARYRVRPNWELRGHWRYDIATNENLRAGGGLTYGNECAEFDLSVSRRYTSTNNVPPSTSVAFSVRLAELGDHGDRDWPARTCATRGI